ncbi:histidine phosphatase family protein [Lysinibacillus piscis]|uniref:Histidine phosphatase family protein n=1 Tax=Lysinibacillus piscis TaxID=2518931 RepID=A0ABQ5NKH7_9BACI|nr:histidine phosphatase family protein [Lysinibacillus sp. KH24]GLC88869.1 hypothetical protein LYSBPC_19960 [Lysinibacillus sp. KH24]
MGDIVTVHLLRHAPTKENREKRYIGWTDAPLADGSVLPIISSTVSTVYGSDLCRCRETAAAYFPNANYLADKQLREMNFGDFEGKTYEELKTDERYCAWLDDPTQSPAPNGETFNAFCQRVQKGFRALPKDNQEYYLVVHGGVIRALLVAFAPTAQSFWSYTVPHHQQWTLHFTQAAWEEGARCMSLLAAPIMAKPTM